MNPTLPLAAAYVRGSTDDQIDTLTAQSDHIARYCDFRNFLLPERIEDEAIDTQGQVLTTCRLLDSSLTSGHLLREDAERLTLRPLSATGPDPWAQMVHKAQVARRFATFCDQGVSGTSSFMERPAASAMLGWMQLHGVKRLIVAKLDRAFRDTLDCLFTMSALAKQGIDIHLLDINLDTSTPVGKMVMTIMAGFAQFENERRSERQKAVNMVRRAQGLRVGTVPYGFTADGTGKLQPHPIEHDLRERILTGDLAECSCNEAARRLNGEGWLTRKGGRWFGGTVQSIRETAKAKGATA